MAFEEGTGSIMQLVIEPYLDPEPEEPRKADEDEENSIDSLLVADSEIEREPLDDLVSLPSAERTGGLSIHELECLGRSRGFEETFNGELISFKSDFDLPAVPILVLELVKASSTLEDRRISKEVLRNPELSGDGQRRDCVPESLSQETSASLLTTPARPMPDGSK
jgi:hypothetical protein